MYNVTGFKKECYGVIGKYKSKAYANKIANKLMVNFEYITIVKI